ncbi:MAG: HRDC domain-containing protein [Myxococcota bacterium]
MLVHGGEYTIAGLRRDLHVALAGHRMIDTQQAAVLLGLAETGYRSLCKSLLGASLPAPVSVDWSERPLQPAHVAHALEDVRHLGGLWSVLSRRIAAADLHDELGQASALVASTPPRANLPSPDRFKHLPGASALPAPGLALLQALVTWRDRKAKELDLPPGKLFPNAQLVALARAPERAADEIQRMRFHSRLVWSDREAVRRIVVTALAESGPAPRAPAPQAATAAAPGPLDGAVPTSAEAARPRKPPRASGPPSPLVKARIERLKRWRRDEAERRGVGLQAILPGAALEQIAWFGAASEAALSAIPGFGQRRVERYASVLLALIADAG